MLYRVFPLRPDARSDEAGGPLYVPRAHQGAGRHDHPDRHGALYLSRVPESAVAEHIQEFRGQTLGDADLRLVGGAHYALATFDDSALTQLVDLDDLIELANRQLRPSMVATRDRTVTQGIAMRIFEEGMQGLRWWSTLVATWSNVTLFAERASAFLALASRPEPLSIHHPVLQTAAQRVGVKLA
ncbi:MAG: hypothetical protein QOF51_1428 [Chloroflexota bacterium]|nr:hypothetical protein [Chloroflexota bacterium]